MDDVNLWGACTAPRHAQNHNPPEERNMFRSGEEVIEAFTTVSATLLMCSFGGDLRLRCGAGMIRSSAGLGEVR